jgi:CRP-like cAMP-binding protein
MALREDLQKVNLFAALPSSALDQLIKSGTTFKLGPHAQVVQQGAADVGFQLLRRGSAVVTVNGVERGTLGPGDYFGEMSLFDSTGRRTATIVSGPEGVETFAISQLTFSALLDRNPEVARALLPALVRRIEDIEAAQRN